jgi:hypothetical protein
MHSAGRRIFVSSCLLLQMTEEEVLKNMSNSNTWNIIKNKDKCKLRNVNLKIHV